MRSLSLQRLLVLEAQYLGLTFTSGGAPVPPLWVFDHRAFMPGVALVAEGLSNDLVGWTLGAQFIKDPTALFGVQVETASLQARQGEGTVLGVMYQRAAERVFQWERGAEVDVHAAYARLLPSMARFLETSDPAEVMRSHG